MNANKSSLIYVLTLTTLWLSSAVVFAQNASAPLDPAVRSELDSWKNQNQIQITKTMGMSRQPRLKLEIASDKKHATSKQIDDENSVVQQFTKAGFGDSSCLLTDCRLGINTNKINESRALLDNIIAQDDKNRPLYAQQAAASARVEYIKLGPLENLEGSHRQELEKALSRGELGFDSTHSWSACRDMFGGGSYKYPEIFAEDLSHVPGGLTLQDFQKVAFTGIVSPIVEGNEPPSFAKQKSPLEVYESNPGKNVYFRDGYEDASHRLQVTKSYMQDLYSKSVVSSQAATLFPLSLKEQESYGRFLSAHQDVLIKEKWNVLDLQWADRFFLEDQQNLRLPSPEAFCKMFRLSYVLPYQTPPPTLNPKLAQFLGTLMNLTYASHCSTPQSADQAKASLDRMVDDINNDLLTSSVFFSRRVKVLKAWQEGHYDTRILLGAFERCLNNEINLIKMKQGAN